MPVSGLRAIFFVLVTSFVLSLVSKYTPQSFKHFYQVHSDSYLEEFLEFTSNSYSTLKDNFPEETLGFVFVGFSALEMEIAKSIIKLSESNLYSHTITNLFDLPPP